jgi:hypothetical protein
MGRRKVVHCVQVHDMFSVGAMDIIVEDLHYRFLSDVCRRTVVRSGVHRVFGDVFSTFRLFCKIKMSHGRTSLFAIMKHTCLRISRQRAWTVLSLCETERFGVLSLPLKSWRTAALEDIAYRLKWPFAFVANGGAAKFDEG